MFDSDYIDYLTKIKFKVFVPDIATRNPRHVQLWGLEIPENEAEARQFRKKQIMVMWSIAEILDFIEKGVFIGIPDRDDIKLMCEYIAGYIKDYKLYLQYNPDQRVSQNVRLVTGLEKLAKDLYSRLTPEEVAPVPQTRINGIGIRFMNPLEMIQENQNLVPEKPTYEQQYGGTIGQVLRMHLEREKR